MTDAEPTTFAALGLAPALLETLAGLGYEEPTPVQEAAIPPLLAGRDLLAEAPTGTGKTAAFALPILQRLAADGLGRAEAGTALALVLVPTRELAMQVAEAVHRYGRVLGARVLPVYGGQPIGLQLRGLRRGLDVVVATPGRAVDHLTRGSLRLDTVEAVVLDEADEMLDMGFAEELDTILSATPPVRQTALFSATISPTIARVAARHLREPVRISVRPERPSDEAPALVRQLVYVVRRPDKLAALGRILDVEDPAAALVFARTRGEVDDLAEALSGRGHDAAALHGGLSQEQRDRVMGRFRDGALDVLVATDVAARGLDIEHISHVVNFDVPSSPDAYVHRIGRTGRAGREGTAITLVEPREHRLLLNIEASTKTRLERATVPTIADLRERRLELLRASLRERLAGDGDEAEGVDEAAGAGERAGAADLDRYRAVVEALADEYDAVEIALAAIALLDARDAGDEAEAEIAPAFLPQDRPVRPARPARPAGAPPWRGPAQGPPAAWAPRPPRPGIPPGGRPAGGGPSGGAWVRLFVGGGRRAGIRPADLVGAITAEAGIPGSAIGAIQITDGFSLVDVADEVVEQVVRALRVATIRGRTLPVRLDRDGR
ncbi:MAG TPA: DEAD/DEAH box helicase [Candidatus Nanopelagicales bacterium]|nr:DEAD/DEAH box helicase [Candidatus Nanopelagicales bacterium]